MNQESLQDSQTGMESEGDGQSMDEDDRHDRSTKKVKMDDDETNGSCPITAILSRHNSDTTQPSECNIPDNALQIFQASGPASYKNKLLGINGIENDYTSDDLEIWENENETEDDMQEENEEEQDPLCPIIPVTFQERKNFCKPWRRALIVKLLGRRIGYRFLYGRLSKMWNISGNFELIDLQNEFFLVHLHEASDYDRVLFDGP